MELSTSNYCRYIQTICTNMGCDRLSVSHKARAAWKVFSPPAVPPVQCTNTRGGRTRAAPALSAEKLLLSQCSGAQLGSPLPQGQLRTTPSRGWASTRGSSAPWDSPAPGAHLPISILTSSHSSSPESRRVSSCSAPSTSSTGACCPPPWSSATGVPTLPKLTSLTSPEHHRATQTI